MRPPRQRASPDACLYLTKNKQNEVINKNSEDLNQLKRMFQARVRRRAPSWYKNRVEFVEKGKTMWKGLTPSGVEVKGYKEPKTTFYPVMGDKQYMINVKFSWIDMWKEGSLEPHCSILNINEDLNITHFLIDDEGLGISHLQKWIKNGLEEIDKISKKEIPEYDMWGQTLGALISLDKVTIYWGDEEYPDDYLEFDQFKIILSKWYDFLLSDPNISNEVYFSVQIRGIL